MVRNMRNKKYIKEREIAEILRKARKQPPDGAMESCIAAIGKAAEISFCIESVELSSLNGRNSSSAGKGFRTQFIKLAGLQLRAIPAWTYAAAAFMSALQFVPFVRHSAEEGVLLNGIVSVVILLIFAWHLMLIPTGGMRELEKSCKYSYGQILSARILCLGLLSFVVTAAAIITAVVDGIIEPLFVISTVLPTICGAFNALLWANYVGNSDAAIMSVYFASAVAAGLLSETISRAGILLFCIITLCLASGIVILGSRLMNGRMYDEDYNY